MISKYLQTITNLQLKYSMQWKVISGNSCQEEGIVERTSHKNHLLVI